MNMKKGDRVFVKASPNNFFGYVEEIKGDMVSVRIKITSSGHLMGYKDDYVDRTPIIRDYKKEQVFPSEEHAIKRMKVLARWINNMTEFL